MIQFPLSFKMIVISACLLLFFAVDGYGVTAGELRSYATRHSIGIEWDVQSDDNHNALCQIYYRIAGSPQWLDGYPLFRVDFNSQNMMAGSLLFLKPATEYEIRLELSDPDGGDQQRQLTVSTKSLPAEPNNGRTLYVVPGSGGGTGVPGNPVRGIDAAQAEALPGDTFLLSPGSYPGESHFTVSGEPGKYIVWKGSGSGKVIVETIRVDADHLWFENLDVEGNQYGLRTYDNPQDIVVTGNRFTGCHYCIYLNHGGTGWFIGDNHIQGDVEPASGDLSGEGIELNHSNDHTVLFNDISRVADGVSYPGRNCDILGNEIYDVSDDGIEPDYGYANNRIYKNRISNVLHNGISFQPMNGAPWYILRNQVAAPLESALKFRDPVDRALLAHNTFIGWQGAQKSGSQFLLGVTSRNNLWISMTDWYVWENGSGGIPDYRTDLDYDGFDWGNYQYGFKWGDRYTDLQSFSQATGLEPHGIRIHRQSCFSTLTLPQPPPSSIELKHYTLRPECNGVNAGVVLATINEDYRGTAPDLGAHEVGAPLQHYGPRDVISPPAPPGLPGRKAVSPVLLLLQKD